MTRKGEDRLPSFSHPVFAEVNALNLPEPDRFVINHSAALDIFGILDRPYGDIDAATSLRNIRFLRSELGFTIARKTVGYSSSGESVEVVVSHDEDKRFDVHRWDFSMYQYRQTGLGRIALKNIIPYSIQHPLSGIRVALPGFVLATKVNTGREQDERDVAYANKKFGIEPMRKII